MSALHEKMKAKLAETGIAHESITVFGAIRCNVHVVCVSLDTANKWVMLLSQVFKGAKVNLTERSWKAAKNNGTCLLPKMRSGYLISVAA